MAVTSQTGTFSFGGQSAKGVVATQYYRHRASDIDLATISDDRLGPPEVGGEPVPTIPYRAGMIATGGALLNPRLENTLGWLLHGTLGSWSTQSGQDVFGTTTGNTGFYHHSFVFHTNRTFIPWMSFRKDIPGAAAAGTDDMGEVFTDCKIVNLTLALPNDGLISSRIDVLGRLSDFSTAPSWTYVNTMEDYQSIPIGCVTGGFLKIPGYSANELPVVAATVNLTNAPLDIRQEKVFGDPYIEDVTVVGRALTVDMVVKWTDPQLYRKILTGVTTGTQWIATPFTSDLDIYVLSPAAAPSVAAPYQLRITSSSVMYQVVGGVRLAGNQALMLRLTGTALAVAGNYTVFHLGNKTTTYTWPP